MGSIVILYTSGRIAVSKSRKVRGPPPLLYLHYKHYFSGTQVGALDKSMAMKERVKDAANQCCAMEE